MTHFIPQLAHGDDVIAHHGFKWHRGLAKSLAYYVEEFSDAKLGMAAAYATGDYTLQAIAAAFKVHYSTVSRAVSGK